LPTLYQEAGQGHDEPRRANGLIAADSKFLDERDDITEFVRGLKAGEARRIPQSVPATSDLKDEKAGRELSDLSAKHGLPVAPSRPFDTILSRRIFDGEQLTERSHRSTSAGKSAHRRNWRETDLSAC